MQLKLQLTMKRFFFNVYNGLEAEIKPIILSKTFYSTTTK